MKEFIYWARVFLESLGIYSALHQIFLLGWDGSSIPFAQYGLEILIAFIFATSLEQIFSAKEDENEKK